MGPTPALIWLEKGQAFPPATQAWSAATQAPGLLAAGGDLDTQSLCAAYDQGIFPWFNADQPVLWWCPESRMVLQVCDFKLHPSLRKTLKKFRANAACEIRMNTAFAQVIRQCAQQPRRGQNGTWIQPAMIQAYEALHQAGHAFSVETWVQGVLVGGLYGVQRGQALFGESMFSMQPDASKIALSALVAFCRAHGLPWIDCQQNTRHLSSLGGRDIARSEFLADLRQRRQGAGPLWHFRAVQWDHLLG